MHPSWRLALVLAGALATTPLWAAPDPQLMPAKGTTPSVSELEGRNFGQWVRDLRESKDPSVREQAIRAVVNFSGPHSGEVITGLIERCTDRDTSVRVRAVMALTVLDVKKEENSRIVKALGARLTDDSQVIVRFHAVLCLVRFGEEARDALASLIKGAEDPASFEIRRLSIRALEACGRASNGGPDPRVTRALLGACAVSHEAASHVRLEAVIALGSLGRSADPMLQAQIERSLHSMLASSDKNIVIWSLVGLMAHDKPSELLVSKLITFLKAPEQRIRGQAILALSIIGTKVKTVLPALIELLQDKDLSIVVQTCGALGAMRDAAAVPALTQLSERKDIDPAVAEHAKAAIKQITMK